MRIKKTNDEKSEEREAKPERLRHNMELVVIECADCGAPFAMPERLDAMFRHTHETFYCPSGHRQFYRRGMEVTP